MMRKTLGFQTVGVSSTFMQLGNGQFAMHGETDFDIKGPFTRGGVILPLGSSTGETKDII